MMSYAILLICDNCAQVDILYTLKNIPLDKRISFLKLCDKLLYLKALRLAQNISYRRLPG